MNSPRRTRRGLPDHRDQQQRHKASMNSPRRTRRGSGHNSTSDCRDICEACAGCNAGRARLYSAFKGRSQTAPKIWRRAARNASSRADCEIRLTGARATEALTPPRQQTIKASLSPVSFADRPRYVVFSRASSRGPRSQRMTRSESPWTRRLSRLRRRTKSAGLPSTRNTLY